MHINFDAVLVRIATKRAKRDSNGVVTDEPAVALTLEVPISALGQSDLGALLRQSDRPITVDIDDGQAAFGIAEVEGRPTLIAEPAR